MFSRYLARLSIQSISLVLIIFRTNFGHARPMFGSHLPADGYVLHPDQFPPLSAATTPIESTRSTIPEHVPHHFHNAVPRAPIESEPPPAMIVVPLTKSIVDLSHLPPVIVLPPSVSLPSEGDALLQLLNQASHESPATPYLIPLANDPYQIPSTGYGYPQDGYHNAHHPTYHPTSQLHYQNAPLYSQGLPPYYPISGLDYQASGVPGIFTTPGMSPMNSHNVREYNGQVFQHEPYHMPRHLDPFPHPHYIGPHRPAINRATGSGGPVPYDCNRGGGAANLPDRSRSFNQNLRPAYFDGNRDIGNARSFPHKGNNFRRVHQPSPVPISFRNDFQQGPRAPRFSRTGDVAESSVRPKARSESVTDRQNQNETPLKAQGESEAGTEKVRTPSSDTLEMNQGEQANQSKSLESGEAKQAIQPNPQENAPNTKPEKVTSSKDSKDQGPKSSKLPEEQYNPKNRKKLFFPSDNEESGSPSGTISGHRSSQEAVDRVSEEQEGLEKPGRSESFTRPVGFKIPRVRSWESFIGNEASDLKPHEINPRSFEEFKPQALRPETVQNCREFATPLQLTSDQPPS